MVLAFFPTPYQDELLYSVCARYADRVRYPSKQAVNLELFGNLNSKPSTVFPRHLGHLIGALPTHHNFTAERMIKAHTLFPFYLPFLPKESADRITCEMIRSSPSGFTITSEAGRTTLRHQNWLRFCPLCGDDDRSEVGEYYWHRLHQAPGVQVCPKHAVFLEDSDVRARFQLTQDWHVSAEHAVSRIPIRPVNSSDSYQQILLRWSSNIAWLLEQHDLQPKLADLCDAYLSGLVEKGVVKRTGSIRKIREGSLTEALNNYFPPAFLDLYEPNRGGRCNKPYQSIKRLLRGEHAHPAHHLLMIEFLGHTAETFFRQLPRANYLRHHKPFGDGPWPCLNPASSHFKQLMVDNCQSVKSENGSGSVVGHFACTHCGFTYRRTGPDLSPNDRLRYSRVKTYGVVWDNALIELWRDTSVSTIKIAQRLGVRDNTIVRQAIRLDLPFPRQGPRSSVTHANLLIVERLSQRQSEHLSKLETFRTAWLSEQSQNSQITRTELANRLRRVYSWLYVHDRKWLDAHKPSANYSRESHRVDWLSRDAQLSEDVRRAASQLKMADGRPARVTKSLIARSLNKVNQLNDKALKNLPLTVRAFSEVVDSPIGFIIRRLKWTADYLQRENIPLLISVLKVRSGICWRQYDQQTIRAAFDHLWQILQGQDESRSLDAA